MAATYFGNLTAHQQAAIVAGWSGWRSDPVRLAEIWPTVDEHVNNSDDMSDIPADVDPLDWLCLCEAAETQNSQRARWVWHETAATAVLLLPDSPTQTYAAIMASDAYSTLTDNDACMTAAAACRLAVTAAGKTVARTITDMIYRGCRPPQALISDTLQTVPTINLDGRLYVI